MIYCNLLKYPIVLGNQSLWILLSSYLHLMDTILYVWSHDKSSALYSYLWIYGCPRIISTLYGPHISPSWISSSHCFWLRINICFIILYWINENMWHKNETFYCISSSNQWSYWTNKSKLRNISMHILFISARWLGWLSSPHRICLQQYCQHNTSTQQTPFFPNMGFHPNFDITITKWSTNPSAMELASRLVTIHEELQAKLAHSNEYMSKYYNQCHLPAPEFPPSKNVWLLWRNIKTTWPSNKLDYKKISPYKIIEKHGKSSYLLKLPPSLKCLHPVFHVSLLEPVIPSTLIPDQIHNPSITKL